MVYRAELRRPCLALLTVSFIVLLWSQLLFGNEYINPAAPKVDIPPYNGQRYEAIVPDTLDIAERAKLAIHGLTSPLDVNDDCSLYWLVNYWNKPPVMSKEIYCNIRAMYMEALPLLRIISGSEENRQVEQVWADSLLKQIGPDGIFYQVKKNGQFEPLGGFGVNYLMRTMMVYYNRDKNQMWKDIIEKLITRLSERCVDKGDYAYFPSYIITEKKLNDNYPQPKGQPAGDFPHAQLMEVLGDYYKLTGYEPARKLGDKFVNFMRYHSEYFGENGEWLRDQFDMKILAILANSLHFGTHSYDLLHMTHYAISTKNEELLKYCKKSFEWGKETNSKIPGQCALATRIGFFLEFLNPYYPTGENCSVAGMIRIALMLTEAGAGDYWDDIDRWVRNHFAENQVMYSSWSEDLPRPQWAQTCKENESNDRVAERNVGTFLSWPAANDGLLSNPAATEPAPSTPSVSIGHMQCCTGIGARTLYDIWKSILVYDNNELKINLLLNRASAWVDIDSYIPYTGQVDLKVKMPLKKISLRLPEWIESGSDQVKCFVNGLKQDFSWKERYILLGTVKAGDIIKVTFPISEQRITRRVYGEPLETVIGGTIYDAIVIKGSTVVDIKPEGKNYPYYQRDHYRSSEPRFRKVERFISDE